MFSFGQKTLTVDLASLSRAIIQFLVKVSRPCFPTKYEVEEREKKIEKESSTAKKRVKRRKKVNAYEANIVIDAKKEQCMC